MAYEATLLQNAGCTTDLSPAILERSLFHATNAYAIPNVRITAASCRTNLPSNTAFRGFGAPQAIAVLESAIRAAARELGVPAMELQERNLVSEGDVTYYGMPLTDVRARECWAQLVARHDPAGLAAQAEAFNAAHPLERRGVDVIPVCFGIAFTARPLNQAEALVHVYADGTVSVTTGAVEMGQGVYAKIQAAVAHELGDPGRAGPRRADHHVARGQRLADGRQHRRGPQRRRGDPGLPGDPGRPGQGRSGRGAGVG